MSVSEEAIIKAIDRINAPLECWGFTNYPRYHAEKFHTYRNCPNKMDPDVAEREKRPIQDYDQLNSEMGGSRGFQGIQYERFQTSSTTTLAMFTERRAQLSQSWNEEVFSSLYQALLMREMVDTSISRYSLVHFAAAKKAKITEKTAR